jgi:hypothetical protein
LNQYFDSAEVMLGFGRVTTAEFDEADEGVQKVV